MVVYILLCLFYKLNFIKGMGMYTIREKNLVNIGFVTVHSFKHLLGILEWTPPVGQGGATVAERTPVRTPIGQLSGEDVSLMGAFSAKLINSHWELILCQQKYPSLHLSLMTQTIPCIK